jgi:hypothetical protein
MSECAMRDLAGFPGSLNVLRSGPSGVLTFGNGRRVKPIGLDLAWQRVSRQLAWDEMLMAFGRALMADSTLSMDGMCAIVIRWHRAVQAIRKSSVASQALLCWLFSLTTPTSAVGRSDTAEHFASQIG